MNRSLWMEELDFDELLHEIRTKVIGECDGMVDITLTELKNLWKVSLPFPYVNKKGVKYQKQQSINRIVRSLVTKRRGRVATNGKEAAWLTLISDPNSDNLKARYAPISEDHNGMCAHVSHISFN